jgi:hypothetical protein
LADSKPPIQIPGKVHEPVRVPAAAPQPAAQKPASLENPKLTAQSPAKTELQTPVPVADSKPPAQKPNIKDIASQAWDLGQQKRYSEAAPLYDQACTGGDASACSSLAYMYVQGRGVARDKSKSTVLYAEACDKGDTYITCLLAGNSYCDGKDVAKDGSRAISLLSKGCDSGQASDCSFIALHYEYGDCVKKDLAMAKQAYSKGCDLGDHDDCDNLKRLK